MRKTCPNNGIYFNFLETFNDNLFISLNLDYTKCYQYQGIPLSYQDDDTFAGGFTTIINTLNALDEGVVLTFVKRNRKEYRGVLDKHLSMMKERTAFDEHRKDLLIQSYKDVRAIEQFLFITHRKLPDCLSSFEKYNPFSRPKFKYSGDEHRQRKDLLENNCSLFLENLARAGIKAKEMVPDEVGSYCFYHLNHSDENIKLQFPIYAASKNGDIYRAQKTIREQVLDSRIELFDDHIKVGNKYISVICVDVLGTCADFEFYDKLSRFLTIDVKYQRILIHLTI
ncbi:MAG: hypothetical protein ABII23_00715 [bacterium]